MSTAEQDRTVNSIVAIAIGLIVAVVIGIATGFLAAKHHIAVVLKPGGHRGQGGQGTMGLAPPTVGYIIFTPPGDGGTNVTCQQYTGGVPGYGGILYARPDLSEGVQNNIYWRGPVNGDVVTVTFATSGGATGPFNAASYSTPTNTGVPVAPGQGDFSFSAVTITRGGTTYTCTNYQGMGVHVEN